MKREKWVEYNACDFCGGNEPGFIDEAVGCCVICGKYYCPNHGQDYYWSNRGRHYPYPDDVYPFCNEHYTQVKTIIDNTEISISFIIQKLRGDVTGDFEPWIEDEERWNDYMELNK